MNSSLNPAWIRYLPAFIRAYLDKRPTLQKMIGNTSWLLVDNFLRLGLGFVISVWLARYLGPHEFGLYNYAYAFAGLFAAFCPLGLDRIVVRELVRDSSARNEILGTTFLLRLGSGVVATIVCLVAVRLMRPGDVLILWFVGIIMAGVVIRAFDVIDLWFQSQVQSMYSVLARSSAFMAILGVKIILILMRAPLMAFIWAGLAEIILLTVGLLWFYHAVGNRSAAWKASFSRARYLLRESWPLILSGVAIVIYMKVDQIMLGEMIGEASVGIYSAATRLSETWYFIPMIVTSTLFPAIVRARSDNLNAYMSYLRRLYRLMFWMAFTIALLVSFVARPLIDLLYGPSFIPAADILVIHIWASIAVFLGIGSGQYLMAENLTRISFYRTLLGLIANVILNLVLIPRYSGVGAAVATLISYFVATFSLVFFRATRGQALMLLRAMVPVPAHR